MGNTLSLKRVFGLRINSMPADEDELIHRAIVHENGGDPATRPYTAPFMFVEYSWGDDMPVILIVRDSYEAVYDETIMRVDALPDTPAHWSPMLERAAAAMGLETEETPGWYFIASYY